MKIGYDTRIKSSAGEYKCPECGKTWRTYMAPLHAKGCSAKDAKHADLELVLGLEAIKAANQKQAGIWKGEEKDLPPCAFAEIEKSLGPQVTSSALDHASRIVRQF